MLLPAMSKEEVMREDIQCEDVDKVKPLDKLFNDQLNEFESGKDKACDREMDKMIWELGDYENEEPPVEALEFGEDKPIEEQLVEKKMIFGSNDQPYYIDSTSDQEETGENVVTAHSISPETRRRKSNARRGNPLPKKKK
jgi:hypothetical protein